MISIKADELWRTIPPEEKLALMNQAASKGVMAVVSLVIVLGTFAVALQQMWIFWTSVVVSPFIYQFANSRAWKGLRPRVMLEYLAARAASRRYAYAVKSERLELNFVFRGKLEHIFDAEEAMDAIEASIQNTRVTSVWIALFGDAVVMMSERNGGAKLEFGALLNDRLNIIARNADDDRGYDDLRELLFEYEDRHNGTAKVRLTSPFPAAMVVFEKRILQQQQEVIQRGRALDQPPESDDSSDSFELGI